jgi:hypothetical protein
MASDPVKKAINDMFRKLTDKLEHLVLYLNSLIHTYEHQSKHLET